MVKRRKNTIKKRKNVAKKRPVTKRKNVAKKRTVKKRKNVAKKRVVRKRKNVAKKRKAPIRKRRNVMRKRRKAPIRKRRNVMRKRKNPVKKRRNVMRKRKNGTRKGQIRKTARRAYMKKRKNPVKKTRIIRKTPMRIPLLAKFMKPVEGLVNKIPVIGKKVSPFLQPAVVAMVGGAGVFGAMASVGRLPYVGQYAHKPYGNAFGATLMGLTLAVATALVPKSVLKADTKKALALAFAGAGGAINATQLMMCGFDLQACAEQNKQLLGAHDHSAAADAVAGLGDGMYYEVQPLAGLAVDNMAGLDYDSSQLGDAMSAPSDLSPEEGEVAVQGRQAYLSRFGMPPRKMAGAKRYQSQMAGKLGHRWGWLIKSLGYERFKQLAQMPAKQRRILIAKLKASAIQASKATFDQELTGAMSGLAINDMSGLAVDMSGLAIDNMAGIAIAGAGI